MGTEGTLYVGGIIAIGAYPGGAWGRLLGTVLTYDTESDDAEEEIVEDELLDDAPEKDEEDEPDADELDADEPDADELEIDEPDADAEFNEVDVDDEDDVDELVIDDDEDAVGWGPGLYVTRLTTHLCLAPVHSEGLPAQLPLSQVCEKNPEQRCWHEPSVMQSQPAPGGLL